MHSSNLGGQHIWLAAMEEFMSKGMRSAKQVYAIIIWLSFHLLFIYYLISHIINCTAGSSFWLLCWGTSIYFTL